MWKRSPLHMMNVDNNLFDNFCRYKTERVASDVTRWPTGWKRFDVGIANINNQQRPTTTTNWRAITFIVTSIAIARVVRQTSGCVRREFRLAQSSQSSPRRRRTSSIQSIAITQQSTTEWHFPIGHYTRQRFPASLTFSYHLIFLHLKCRVFERDTLSISKITEWIGKTNFQMFRRVDV